LAIARLGVGCVGYGFIGKVHTYAYKNLPFYYDPTPARVELVGVCTAHEDTAEAGLSDGYQFATTDFTELLGRSDIDIINVCTPNYVHKDQVIAAAKAGKHVYCDKPLALDLAEAREIQSAVRAAGVTAGMTFQYRHVPAILRARQLMDEGAIGEPFSVRAAYLHAGYIDSARPMSWRMRRETAGAGALFDLGSHVLDLVRFLCGEFASVSAEFETFTKRRPIPGGDEMGDVDVDDLALLQVRMRSGMIGTCEASRVATGTNDELRIEIHGRDGALLFNLQDPNWLWVFDNTEDGGTYGGRRGFKRIESVMRYPSPAKLPGPKFSPGWFRFHVACAEAFVESVIAGRDAMPSMDDGVAVQEVMEAALRSADTGGPVSLPLED